MKVIPFKAEHFWKINVQAAQAYVLDYVKQEDLVALEAGNSFTCIEGEQVLACFGWHQQYLTRGLLWAYLSAKANSHMVGITRIAKRLADALHFKRLEMEVDYEFEQGHRWARMLGFELEAERLRAFRVNGGDSSLYVRFKE